MQVFVTKMYSIISENVALRKTTNQSPLCVDYEGAGSLAVDGNTTTVFGDVQPYACTCVMEKQSTYWIVDLEKTYPIYNIQIYQRNSSKFSFLYNLLYIYMCVCVCVCVCVWSLQRGHRPLFEPHPRQINNCNGHKINVKMVYQIRSKPTIRQDNTM